jgi:erythronate-4-phosphate dehydrogenase
MYEHLPADSLPVEIKSAANPWHSLYATAKYLYPLARDNEVMKLWFCLSETELVSAFTDYRRRYPVRRAWQHAPIRFSHPDAKTVQLAKAMGLKVI